MRHTERTKDNPISDLYEALELLVRRDHRSGGYLNLPRRRSVFAHEGPQIIREHAGGWGGMELVGMDVYSITEELARKLKEDGYTKGKPEWGYTDEHIRHVSDYGEREFWRMRGEIGAAMGTLTGLFRTQEGDQHANENTRTEP